MIDAFNRKIVCWQLATNMRTDLVLNSLKMALGQLGGGADVELIHRSDRGWQGEFNRSSQRSSERSCDEREESEVGAGRSAGDAVAGASAGGASGPPPAVHEPVAKQTSLCHNSPHPLVLRSASPLRFSSG